MSEERFEFGVAATVTGRALDILNNFILPSIPVKTREGFETIADDIEVPTVMTFASAIETTVGHVVAGRLRSVKSRIDGFDVPKHAWAKVEWTTSLVKKTNTIKVKIKVGTVIRGCSSMTVDLTFNNKPAEAKTVPVEKKKKKKAETKPKAKSRPKKRVKTA